ncbi:transcriptional regulator, IclR family [Tistlia consotensis]|uniref:Transcriptional regulator, IclR family n=1 Tax=Tistlia consotensis USBA 355 TaxID=560819 RepID=A0A1Y6C091_9PROT|nr:IclR family transcriptional regulator [Tistlia consotensis]SMF38836.1 transcriptional regulator, IclR family [Tistlia consotensis USBA 355]SNR36804.1 transcriptional regulator, IclR family [Tistlia consotensis]
MTPPRKLNKNHDRYIVPGLEKGIDLLEALVRAQRPLTNAELAQSLGIARSSVFRLVYTLQYKGMIEPDSSGHAYQLGAGVLRLGYQYLSRQDIAQVARGELEVLADRTGLSAHLAIRSGDEIVYLLHVPGPSGFVSNISAGARLPAHATPMGQLLLSQLSEEELASLYAGVELQALTAQTPTTLQALRAATVRAAADGYVISRGAVELGGISIAAPLLDAAGEVVACIDVSGPEVAYDPAQIEQRYRNEVVRSAALISRRLGHI